MEKILIIEETNFETKENDWCSYEGYQIITDKQTIKLGISDGQSCCERSGYFMSEDDFSEFIGANLIDLAITDTCLNTKKLEEKELYVPDLMFVNLNTDKGLLQFVAYNSHKGNYGHLAVVVSDQLSHEEIL
jgi:hypothetical protein